TVPSDNPSPGSPIWACGFRNVFRFCFQPGSGRLYAGDNGPQRDDELNLVEKGRNYGWPNALGAEHNPQYVDPVLTWPDPAVTGILFFHSTRYPGVSGDLLVGAYVTGDIYRVGVTAQGAFHKGVLFSRGFGITD